MGTAAWSNPPAQRQKRPNGASHLQHYASRFDAVEINSSFYRSHRRATYERWRADTPTAFRFSVKLPRTITHECALRHYQGELREFCHEVGGLGDKLSVLLVQTPGSLEFESRVAARFFRALTGAFPRGVACEPRHASWFTAAAEDTFRRFGIARVAVDPAKMPGAAEPAGARRLLYYRLHGSPRMYYSAYSTGYLKELSGKLACAMSTEIWCIFDNTAQYASWDNALELQKLLRTRQRTKRQVSV